MIVLRDGRKLIGVLRSWDQFGTPRRRGCSNMVARVANSNAVA